MVEQYADPMMQQVPQDVGYQQVPVSQDEMYANMLQEERIKNVISQISPDNQLYEIEMRIKGFRKNIYTGAWEKISEDAPEPHPLLVQRFIAYLSSLLNQNTSLSNFSEMQINKLMFLVIEYITDDLSTHSEMYGLQHNYTERTRIGHIVFNCVFSVLNRALNGAEARRMWGALALTENSAMGASPQQKAGMMDALKFWK